MTERRRYTKRQKATAVIAAEMSSVSAAAEAEGIPRKTLSYWVNDPDMAELRQKTREEQGEATRTLGLIVLGEIKRRLPEFEPKDLAVLYGILTDKGQLLTGQATSRSESRELIDGMDDHERETLNTILREAAEKVEA